jgi:hypothetical protein
VFGFLWFWLKTNKLQSEKKAQFTNTSDCLRCVCVVMKDKYRITRFAATRFLCSSSFRFSVCFWMRFFTLEH